MMFRLSFTSLAAGCAVLLSAVSALADVAPEPSPFDCAMGGSPAVAAGVWVIAGVVPLLLFFKRRRPAQ
jgi:hypothetical protein